MVKRTVAAAAFGLVALAGPAAAQAPYPPPAEVEPTTNVRDDTVQHVVQPARPAPAALPRTGDDSVDMGRVGGILVAAGGALVFMARRRQRVDA